MIQNQAPAHGKREQRQGQQVDAQVTEKGFGHLPQLNKKMPYFNGIYLDSEICLMKPLNERKDGQQQISRQSRPGVGDEREDEIGNPHIYKMLELHKVHKGAVKFVKQLMFRVDHQGKQQGQHNLPRKTSHPT